MCSLISDTHSDFVHDRQILDGILIANEAVDKARKLKKDFLLFKVDFEKAYGYVDSGYLDVVMGTMDFPPLWRKWMKECVSSATVEVVFKSTKVSIFYYRLHRD